MNPLRTILLLAALLAVTSRCAMAADAPSAGVALELLADTAAVAPGVPFRLGLRVCHQPGFHTYWRAPGIVGMATSVAWQLPEGFRADPLQWPAPQDVKMLQYKAYGFERDVLLVARITPPRDLPAGATLKLTAHATWMACASTCHPGTRLLSLELPVAAAPAPSNRPAFAAAAVAVPGELSLAGLRALLADGRLSVFFTLPPNTDPTGLRFIPEANLYDPNTEQELSVDAAGHCQLSFPVMPLALDSVPSTITGLLFRPAGWPQLNGATFGRASFRTAGAAPP